ncbi:FAD-dependent oxidoreductase [Sphingomonas oligophenolica]|uniref:NAD(P)/FAD-dependent oxidoreductase n=1 Tax=Sphingomonas oligophenolica TaxID=301154 RepID=A0ABU9Y0M2_9SPHN
MAEPKKIVIIGGGIAGLCAGVYARRCGYAVDLVEMHDVPGGLATSWHRQGYTFETCLHWLLGSKRGRPMFAHWQEVFDIGKLDFVHPEIFVTVEGGGKTLTIYTDVDMLEAELLCVAPEDAEEIGNFTRAIRKLTDFEMPDLDAEGLRGWLSLVPMLRHVPTLEHWSHISMRDYGARFTNPLLRQFFTGGSAELSALTLILSLAWMNQRDADYPIGGSQAVIMPIVETFRNLGGRLITGTRVERILVENGAAVGVALAGGGTIRADQVISAADGHATIYEMLGGAWRSDAIDRIYEQFEPFPSYLQVSFGVACDLADEPGFVTRVLDTPIAVDPGTEAAQVSFRIFNYDPSFAPIGKTAVTAMIPTRNHAYWCGLRDSDPACYRREKDRIAAAVLDVFEQRLPGISAAIEVTDVSTPASVIRYTGNWQGSMEGWLLTPRTGLTALETTLPGLKNFRMIGQWVMPGGGLPTGLLTARAAIHALCREDGIPFDVAEPVAHHHSESAGAAA